MWKGTMYKWCLAYTPWILLFCGMLDGLNSIVVSSKKKIKTHTQCWNQFQWDLLFIWIYHTCSFELPIPSWPMCVHLAFSANVASGSFLIYGYKYRHWYTEGDTTLHFWNPRHWHKYDFECGLLYRWGHASTFCF